MHEGPKDPIGPMAEGAISTHELFKAYIAAGFTRREALEIVIGLCREAMRIAQGK
jgi:hypothetical protein